MSDLSGRGPVRFGLGRQSILRCGFAVLGLSGDRRLDAALAKIESAVPEPPGLIEGTGPLDGLAREA